MPLINRDKDSSEQRYEVTANFGALGTGVTNMVGPIASSGTLDGVRVAAFGLSGTPTLALAINRFIVGTGATVITGGMTTLTVPEWGTSGLGVGVLASSGSTLLSVQAGDYVQLVTGGSNAAVKGAAVSLVLKATQDIKGHFGIS